MQSLEREPGLRVRLQADLARQTQPTNAGMAVFATVTKGSVVHLGVTGDARRSHAWGLNVALVVAVFALRLRVSGRETQARMVGSDVVDLSPIGFVVTRRALCAGKRALMGIFVTGNAIAAKPQVRGVSSSIGNVVTLRTANCAVRAPERPTGHSMIEARFAPLRPANELRVPSEMLDVTAAAVLLLILRAAMKTLACSDAGAQIVVASETGIRVDSSPGRVALAAIGIAIDLCVRAGQFSGR